MVLGSTFHKSGRKTVESCDVEFLVSSRLNFHLISASDAVVRGSREEAERDRRGVVAPARGLGPAASLDGLWAGLDVVGHVGFGARLDEEVGVRLSAGVSLGACVASEVAHLELGQRADGRLLKVPVLWLPALDEGVAGAGRCPARQRGRS